MLLADYSPSSTENYNYGPSNESTPNQTSAGSMAYQAYTNPTASFGRDYTQNAYSMADYSTPANPPNYSPPRTYAPPLSPQEEPRPAAQERNQ